MRSLARFISAMIISALIAAPATVSACTLWAAAGEAVPGGGTIIAKNRDWRPDNQTGLRVISQGGYRFVSLYSTGNDSPGTKAGINEKGLVIVSASAPSYLDLPELRKGRTPIRTVLSRYASVAEAIAALEAGKWTCGPEFLVLADGREIAAVEFGLDGAAAVGGRTGAGTVYHTNHYLAPGFIALNQGKLNSSLRRYERIKELMEAKDTHDVADFRTYSADGVLWRAGTSPAATRTLSSWIIRQAPDGTAVLYLKLANPGKPVAEYEFSVADLFAGTVDLTKVE